MKYLVSGSSGLIGTALCDSLSRDGHEVVRLVRGGVSDGERRVAWDPAAGKLDGAEIEGFDGVIHLAGESIATGRWSVAKKARIRDSRVDATMLLAGALANLERKPSVFISGSAIGYYGESGDAVVNEDSSLGAGFLAEVCRDWESATAAATDSGIRVVTLRAGVVLSRNGGALAKMLTPFKLGVGGVVGSGNQYMSWIDLDDEVGAIRHCLGNEACRGAVNAVGPNPVTNRGFTKTLGKVLGRPTVFPMPAFAARLAFGEMADALLLASTRVEPLKLLDTGFRFEHADLEDSLRHLLAR